ncbi:hypothetical protein ACSBR1_043658 [Camellia fascicularis]
MIQCESQQCVSSQRQLAVLGWITLRCLHPTRFCIEILKQCNPTVVGNFLKNLRPQHWSNAHFRYGEMWSNAAESFNNWVQKARHLPITHLVDAIRAQIMEQRSKRKVKSSV